MTNSLQTNWYGITKYNSKFIPKYLTKGLNVVTFGDYILTPSKKDAAILKQRLAGKKDYLSFVITDKQFGLISIGANAKKHPAFRNHFSFVQSGVPGIIPITQKQLGMSWHYNDNRNNVIL
jgi:hypothetical protein